MIELMAPPGRLTKIALAFRGHKGGTGKSTVTINTAIGFACSGLSTAVIDVDPQQSTFKILTRRNLETIGLARVDVFSITTMEDLVATVTRLHQTHEVIIFDTAGNVATGLGNACLLYCQLAILPFNTSKIDLDTAPGVNDALDMIKQEHPNLATHSMANRLTTHHQRRPNKIKYMADHFVTLHNLPMIDTSFSNRELYTDSLDEYRSVLEFKGEAAVTCGDEVKSLLVEIVTLLTAQQNRIKQEQLEAEAV